MDELTREAIYRLGVSYRPFLRPTFDKISREIIQCSFCKCLLAGLDVETTIEICEKARGIAKQTPYRYSDVFNFLINEYRPKPMSLNDALKVGLLKKTWWQHLYYGLKIDEFLKWMKKYKKGES